MRELIAGLIDVFADEPLTGNPLAVVEDGDGLSDDEMKRISSEFNQAETTFILKSARADRKLRSFTANGSEVFGAGHNALGAWLWLAERGALGAMGDDHTFHQEIGADVLPITLTRAEGRIRGRMRQAPLKLLPAIGDVRPLAAALGLETSMILTSPPPRPADTGAAHLMVRVSDKVTVDQASPSQASLFAVLCDAGAEGCYVYALDPSKPERAYARFFNPTVGLWEDAATGTAAGPLAAYLSFEGVSTSGKLTVEQGTKMGRRSILNIRLGPDPELSGAGVVVMRGILRV